MFFNNHCYWVSTEKVDSIVEARDKCQKRNARLASIETAKELTFLSAHLEGGESTKWLTSGREIGNSSPRQWAWSLDPTWQQPIKYQQETQWQPGQPDNKLERCIALSKKNGVHWSDTNCAPGGKQLNFICEQGMYLFHLRMPVSTLSFKTINWVIKNIFIVILLKMLFCFPSLNPLNGGIHQINTCPISLKQISMHIILARLTSIKKIIYPNSIQHNSERIRVCLNTR